MIFASLDNGSENGAVINPILMDIRAYREARPQETWWQILEQVESIIYQAGFYITADWNRYEVQNEFTQHALRALRRLAALEARS